MSSAIKDHEIPGDTAVRSGFVEGHPRLAYDCAGEGEPVVFLHGIGGNRRNWLKQLGEFARQFRAVAWDARGYGDSDDYPGPLVFSDFAADLTRLLDHLGEPSAHIVGLSMGGNIALDFAVHYQSRARSLVLCDTDRGMTHLSEDERELFVKLRRDPLLADKELADIAPAIVDSLVGPNASEEARSLLTDSMLRVHKESYVKSVEATVNFDIRHAIGRILCPTLVVVGEFDELTPLSEAQSLCAGIRSARLAVIPDAGHVSNVEQPEAFNREVLSFLRKVSS